MAITSTCRIGPLGFESDGQRLVQQLRYGPSGIRQQRRLCPELPAQRKHRFQLRSSVRPARGQPDAGRRRAAVRAACSWTATRSTTRRTSNQGYNELGFLWTPRAHDAVVTNNYFIGGKQAIDLERWDSMTFQNNTIYSKSGDESMLITRGDQNPALLHAREQPLLRIGPVHDLCGCDYWPCPTSQTVNFSTWMAVTGLDRGSSFTPGAPTGVWTGVRPNSSSRVAPTS